MSTNVIEKILNADSCVIEHDVELEEEKNKFILDLDVVAPRDNYDWNNLMKLKNKIRSAVNRAYNIEFIFRFTT
jgi:hypothetical protein